MCFDTGFQYLKSLLLLILMKTFMIHTWLVFAFETLILCLNPVFGEANFLFNFQHSTVGKSKISLRFLESHKESVKCMSLRLLFSAFVFFQKQKAPALRWRNRSGSVAPLDGRGYLQSRSSFWGFTRVLCFRWIRAATYERLHHAVVSDSVRHMPP